MMRTIGENTGFPVGQLKVLSDTVGRLSANCRPARSARKSAEKPVQPTSGARSERVKMMAADGCLVAVNLAKAQLEIRMTIGLRESPHRSKTFTPT